jgi:hypothetical protein
MDYGNANPNLVTPRDASVGDGDAGREQSEAEAFLAEMESIYNLIFMAFGCPACGYFNDQQCQINLACVGTRGFDKWRELRNQQPTTP